MRAQQISHLMLSPFIKLRLCPLLLLKHDSFGGKGFFFKISAIAIREVKILIYIHHQIQCHYRIIADQSVQRERIEVPDQRQYLSNYALTPPLT